jgi:hypothetical protein
MKTFKELLEEKVISENMEEIQEMAYTDVQIAFDNAKRIMEMMDEGIEPESWNYSKITMAADYLTSVYTAMRAKKSEMPDMPEMDYFSMYGEEVDLDESPLLGPKGGIHRAASANQSDKEYLHQRSFKNKWKSQNPGKKWPGYEKAGYKHPSYKTEETDLDESDTHKTKDGRTAKKGIWYNINKRREKGLPRKKPGDKGYPETLDIKK